MRQLTQKLLIIEERARKFFEHIPFTHAFFAGIGVTIFWRGVWELLDVLGVGPISSIILGSLILGGVGVFIQTFLGNTLIIKNVSREEQKESKEIKDVAQEIKKEEITLTVLSEQISELKKLIDKK